MQKVTKKISAVILGIVIATTSISCTESSSNSKTNQSTTDTGAQGESVDQGTWPRTVKHELGETTVESQPKRIANTAVSATGTLLAIDAPVVASAATEPSEITDSQGFFSQWSDVAKEKGVEVLYPNLEFDMESLIAQDPDLVIVSVSGADSVSNQYDQISAQFPTIAIDYSKQSWQSLAKELGAAIGLEENAEKTISEFNSYVADAKSNITAPSGGISIVSYNGPGAEQGVAKKKGSHGILLEALGFTVIEASEDLDTSSRPREDFSFVSLENLPKVLDNSDAVFLLSSDETNVSKFEKEAVLANLKSTKNKAVYPLGLTSFRIDPYSGRDIVDAVSAAYGK